MVVLLVVVSRRFKATHPSYSTGLINRLWLVAALFDLATQLLGLANQLG